MKARHAPVLTRLARRWLTRPGRLPRRLRGAAAFAMAALSLLMLSAGTGGASAQTAASTNAAGAGNLGEPGGTAKAVGSPPSKYPFAPGAGAPTQSTSTSPQVIEQGQTLFAEGCSSCHGMALQGRPGIAPALRGVGPGPVDFYLSTGRMPLSNYRDEPERAPPLYSPQQIAALAAFVATYGGPAAPTANPAQGSLSNGLQLFTLNCAGCHQIVARGGLTIGAQVPDLSQATPQQIAEAVRMGPYLMPHFDAHQIDQYGLDSIARYVLWTRHPDNAGGWGIYNLGPIPEGMVAWLLALGSLLIVARLIGERTTT